MILDRKGGGEVNMFNLLNIFKALRFGGMIASDLILNRVGGGKVGVIVVNNYSV